MYSKSYSPRGLARLDSFKSEATGKVKLRVYFPKALFGGKAKYMSLELDDTPKNRKYAENKVEAINSDILNNTFDISLDRYRPQAKQISHIAKLRSLSLPNIAELYSEYIQSRKETVSANTYYENYLHWLKRLNRPDMPQEALEISDEGATRLLEYLNNHFTSNANFRLIEQLGACLFWANKSPKNLNLASNPYEKIKEGMHKPKKKRKNPAFFSKEEIQEILSAFKANDYYSHYYTYMAFLFATGARPSEVVCLTWNDIDSRFIQFTKRAIRTENGKVVAEGLKSEDKRKFPINQTIKLILKEQKERGLSDDLIFPSPQGLMIDIQNFSRRAWKKILQELEYKYKRPYTSRASFITHTLEHLDSKDVGRVVGNNPESIYRHYAGCNIASLQIPDIF